MAGSESVRHFASNCLCGWLRPGLLGGAIPFLSELTLASFQTLPPPSTSLQVWYRGAFNSMPPRVFWDRLTSAHSALFSHRVRFCSTPGTPSRLQGVRLAARDAKTYVGVVTLLGFPKRAREVGLVWPLSIW
jgi:hypothetical protein